MLRILLLLLTINASAQMSGLYPIGQVERPMSNTVFDPTLYRTLYAGEDSLFTRLELPAIKDAATTPVTVGEEVSLPGGIINAVKFYKVESTATAYTCTIWKGIIPVWTVDYRSTSTGWQRVPCDLSVEAGKYTISVFYPVGRYAYTNSMHPRTRGNIIAQAGLYAGGKARPEARYGASFFVDLVFRLTQPLVVNAGRDSVYSWPVDSIRLNGKVSGDNVQYVWEVLDRFGEMKISGLNTLNPVIVPEADCGAVFVLTATDRNGTTMQHDVYISVMPNFEPYIIRFMNELRIQLERRWRGE